jgi:hypothetical protein
MNAIATENVTTIALPVGIVAVLVRPVGTEDVARRPLPAAVTAPSMETIMVIHPDAAVMHVAVVAMMDIASAALLDADVVRPPLLARTPTCHPRVPSSLSGTIPSAKAT